MVLHELAGQPAPRSVLVDVPKLISDYFILQPDASSPEQRVSFGTSGHRGSSSRCTFNEDHILAVTQAICDYRRAQGFNGPLFLGKDTHALSEPAHGTALEVLVANNLEVRIAPGMDYTPTPAVSHAILCHNSGRRSGLADGIVITPSHNPPEDGGFKYNPPHGGPAEATVTGWIANRANRLLREGNRGVQRVSFQKAIKSTSLQEYDFTHRYIEDLNSTVRMDVIRSEGVRIGVDPMGGAGVGYWGPLAEMYGLNLHIVNESVDPTFRFMTLDWDGKIRMDCSSPHAMAGLIKLKDRFDIAFGNDSDFDRHGIVTPTAGLMNPNHFIAVAVCYLFQDRSRWGQRAAVGKTLVSSSMIDRVAADLNRPLTEVPVGFKWFVDGLLRGSLGFGGEESAGASYLRRDGTVWTTDKDGFIMDLLAAEITATTGKDPTEHYRLLEERFGSPVYQRIDTPATPAQKEILASLSPESVSARELAGESIQEKLTRASGNGAEIGGLKVVTENGWFAARPSGTEDVYKLYAESFLGEDHLRQIQQEAGAIIEAAIGGLEDGR